VLLKNPANHPRNPASFPPSLRGSCENRGNLIRLAVTFCPTDAEKQFILWDDFSAWPLRGNTGLITVAPSAHWN
jgi:hypothetical protein